MPDLPIKLEKSPGPSRTGFRSFQRVIRVPIHRTGANNTQSFFLFHPVQCCIDPPAVNAPVRAVP